MADNKEKDTAAPAEDARSKPEAPAASKAAEAPDPDEADLDELDDMLDDFSVSESKGKPSAPAASNTASKAPEQPPVGSDEFTKQLEKDMEALMSEIDNNPDMKEQMEAMAKLLEKEEVTGAAAKDGSKGPFTPGAEDAFQETIKRTMERMKTSGEQAGAAAAASGDSEQDLLEQLLKEMASGGGGEGSEEEFSKMLLGMMEQLTNKEILYEPMRDLHQRFPDWMKENEGKVPKEDMDRYIEQQGLVKEIVGRFEREGYSDDNPEDREYIVERMQKMQAAGSPPPDLVGDVKETQDALEGLDEGCAQQ